MQIVVCVGTSRFAANVNGAVPVEVHLYGDDFHCGEGAEFLLGTYRLTCRADDRLVGALEVYDAKYLHPTMDDSIVPSLALMELSELRALSDKGETPASDGVFPRQIELELVAA